jgi:hypothetical protein
VRVAPSSNSWTEFNVTDTDGTVRIAARKGDLTITDDQGTATLPQGQETTRDDQSNSPGKDKTDKKKKHPGPAPGAVGGELNSMAAIGVGAAGIATVGVWVLTRSSNPVSPSSPNDAGGR